MFGGSAPNNVLVDLNLELGVVRAHSNVYVFDHLISKFKSPSNFPLDIHVCLKI